MRHRGGNVKPAKFILVQELKKKKLERESAVIRMTTLSALTVVNQINICSKVLLSTAVVCDVLG